MKLTALTFPAKPSGADPLAQRGYVGLVWSEDKSLVEFTSELDDAGVAAFVAIRVAVDVYREVEKGNGKSSLQVLRTLVEHGRRLIEQAEAEAAR